MNSNLANLSTPQASLDAEPLRLEEILSANERSDAGRCSQLPDKLEDVVIGQLVDWDETGNPLVDFSLNPSGSPIPASSVAVLSRKDQGRDVALLFHGGDPNQPLIMGKIQEPQAVHLSTAEGESATTEPSAFQANIDDERIVFNAQNEIVLRCGKASITLTRAGKVLIRGAFLLSRSSGVNRIKGGSVQIN